MRSKVGFVLRNFWLFFINKKTDMHQPIHSSQKGILFFHSLTIWQPRSVVSVLYSSQSNVQAEGNISPEHSSYLENNPWYYLLIILNGFLTTSTNTTQSETVLDLQTGGKKTKSKKTKSSQRGQLSLNVHRIYLATKLVCFTTGS